MALIRSKVLITDEYFRDRCPVPLNFQLDDIRPYFTVAERIWVEPVLGTALYGELIQQVADNAVTDVNATLLLEIYQYEAYAVCYEALPFLTYRINETGITRGKSDNADAVDIKDVNYINAHFLNQLEVLKKGLKDFLNRNAEYYPLYRPDDGDSCPCRGRANDMYAPHAFTQVYRGHHVNTQID